MQEKATHKTLLLYTQVCYDTVFYISKNSTQHYVGYNRGIYGLVGRAEIKKNRD